MTDTSELIALLAHLTRFVADRQSLGEPGFGDLSMRQIAYLDQIGRSENPTPSELARSLKLSKPTVTAALDRLEQAGYIRKVQSDQDRRSIHLHLTEQGEDFARRHDQVHARIAALLVAPLDENEAGCLVAALRKILASLDQDNRKD